ncbi:MAG: hypothetical protein R3C59_01690 [Planctomycetaceae bacterium]
MLNLSSSSLCLLTFLNTTTLLVHTHDFVQVAIIEDKRLDESSGLAISYTHPGAVWLHNDSGAAAELFLVGMDGRTQAVVRLPSAKAVDWEDMCSFRTADQSWLLIGDIGDNERARSQTQRPCTLYLLKEPVVPRANGVPTITWNVSATIRFEFEDGSADCESVAVDTERQEILLLTKTSPQKNGLYRLPLDLETPEQMLTAKKIASPFIPFATALDVSPSGRTMVVCSMLNALVVTRTPSQSWTDAFASPGLAMDLPPRKQGETICFDQTGQWLYVNSETPRQPLWRVKLPAN